jgi:hypothetical protein
MIENFVYRTGKLPKHTDQRTLQLATYLTPQAPAPPAAVDNGTAVEAIEPWHMLGNDTTGDCAFAAQAHADMLWVANSGRTRLPISTKQCLGAYSAVTGYDPTAGGPGANPTDRGTTLLAALNYWRKTGIDDQKIAVFAEVQLADEVRVRQAIDLFGCVYIGVQLPDVVLPTSATLPFPAWTVTPDGTPAHAPNPENGHAVIYCGYDSEGPTVVTWGATVAASWAFHAAYCDEAYAMVARGYFAAGRDPKGLDIAQLEHDLRFVSR